MENDQDKGFLGRWERQKRAARRAELQERPKETPAPEETEQTVDLEGLSETEQLEKLGLPEPDDMLMGDDFKQFLQKSVPQKIRNRALRRLWTSNPVLANLDGLNDYEQDFTDLATNAKNVATSYVVGQGFAKRIRDVVDQVAPDDADPEMAALPTVDTAPRHGDAATAEDAEAPEAAPQPDEAESLPESDTAMAPRRMRFT